MSSDDDLKKDLKRTLDQLTPREREILQQRFGISVDPSATLAEVARQFDITREKLREIEKRAREKSAPEDDPDKPR